MHDTFSDRNIENVIELNRQIVGKRNENFGLSDHAKFYDIFRNVNGFSSVVDPKIRVTKKASTLLSGIVWGQPFKNGNKATGTVITKYFLRKMDIFFH